MAVLLSGNDLWQVAHPHASVTKQYNLVPVVGQQCPATGKVTVGPAVVLACVTLLTYLSGLSTYGLKEDKHPANTPCGVSCSLWSPYVIGQTIIFLPCDFYLSSSFFFFFLA